MTTLTQIATNQYQPATPANANFAAVAPVGIFGKNYETTTGLTFGYFGGLWPYAGTFASVSNGTVSLTGTATNYIETTRAGTVSKNTSAFSAGSIPLFTAATDSLTINTLTDYRIWARPLYALPYSKTWPSDASYTLTYVEAMFTRIFLSGATLTTTRDLLVPAHWSGWVRNGTGGSQSIRVVESGSPQGSGCTIANGSAAWVAGDGTNIYRATADA